MEAVKNFAIAFGLMLFLIGCMSSVNCLAKNDCTEDEKNEGLPMVGVGAGLLLIGGFDQIIKQCKKCVAQAQAQVFSVTQPVVVETAPHSSTESHE